MTKKTNNKITYIKAGELVVDMDLYPRQKINRFHVSKLHEALKSGKELPPIYADKETKIISDGNHRVEAYLKFGGPMQEVPAFIKDYKGNKAEMFKDAVTFNSSHGMAFSIFDIGRILMKCEDMEIKIDMICRYLNITEHKAEKILNRIKPVVAPTKKGKMKETGVKVSIKRGMTKLSSQDSITEEQAEINEHALGVAATRLAKDLLDKIEGNCILYTADLLYMLEKLRDALTIVIEAHKEDEAQEG